MERNNTWIWWVVGVIVIVAAGLFFISGSSMSTPTTGTDTTSQIDSNTGLPVGTTTDTMAARTVTYNGSSFNPALVTIRPGGTVTFTSTAGAMWVASDPHPSHTGYDGTSRDTHCAPGYSGATPFDQCAPGTTYTVTLNKVGTWGYHNHLNDDAHGQVTVVAQ